MAEPSTLSRRGVPQKIAAEALGTFALVFVGCGAVVADEMYGGLGHAGISLAFGLVVMVMVYSIGHISGAHINPAVTIAFAAVGRFSWKEVPGYVIAQTAGACAAAFLLCALYETPDNLGTTVPAGSWQQAFAFEVVLTFLLMFVIKAVATDTRAVGDMAGWAIGSTVAMASLIGGGVSGASMNPARTIGPALASGTFTSMWIYVAAPILGALLGAFVYQRIRCDTDTPGDVGGCC